MSAPAVPSPRRSYNDAMWNTYITEAIQSGNHKQYCTDKNIPYRTFNTKYSQYKQSNDKENWSPKSRRRYRHRVFTDSTEKQAVEQFETQYDNTNKPRDANDLAALLMMIHNQKNPASVVINVSCSTLARIKQQYNMSTKRATKRKSTMMSVDDSVLTKFQTLVNDIFVNYDNHNLIMNSDTTRIQQSMTPTNVLTFKNKPANVDQGVATNHTVAAMCTCTAEGKILPIYFTVPLNQLSKFSVVNEHGQPVSTKKQTQNKQPSGNITNITNNVTNNIQVNIFNIPHNDKPVRDSEGNRYTGTESGNMNNEQLIKLIEDIIVEHTQDQPAAWLLDSLGYQHNNRTLDICNKHNITVYRIPPNTTGWLQPCDIVLFGSSKQKVRHQHKLDRQSDIQPTLQRTCQQFSDALNSVSTSAVKRTWDRIRTYTPEQLRHKSSSSSLKRAKSLFTGHSSSQP